MQDKKGKIREEKSKKGQVKEIGNETEIKERKIKNSLKGKGISLEMLRKPRGIEDTLYLKTPI